MAKFEEMEFDAQLKSIRGTLSRVRDHIQIVAVRAHDEYVRGKADNPDYDAVARVLNTVKVMSVATSHSLAKYFQAHGPYDIVYKKDEEGHTKWYVSKDKSEDAKAFEDMAVTWYNWNDKRDEKNLLKGVDDLRKILAAYANDKEHKKHDAASVAAATTAINVIFMAEADGAVEEAA